VPKLVPGRLQELAAQHTNGFSQTPEIFTGGENVGAEVLRQLIMRLC